MYKSHWFCRWCGKLYLSLEHTPRDGFCCKAHKQALYRAYKKYVTNLPGKATGSLGPKVTHKKKKKR